MKTSTGQVTETGTITQWEPSKGFGFIESESGVKFFLHINKWQSKPLLPNEGLTVEFKIESTQKGCDAAVQVRVINTPKPASIIDMTVSSNSETRLSISNPYQFIKLSTQNTVTDNPVWHDGVDSQTSLNGEMSFTLRTLTPLLVGQWQYKANELTNRKLLEPHTEVDDDKAILEPLRLPDGRVVLPGSSIKGMVRNSLSALLSAPMERVAERSYSYRPNAIVQKDESFRRVRPAIIAKVEASQEMQILVLPNAKSVWFGHKKNLISPIFTGQAVDWDGIVKEPPKQKKIKGKLVEEDGKPVMEQKNHFISVKSISVNTAKSTEPFLNSVFAHYRGGIDGNGILYNAFHNSGKDQAVKNNGETENVNNAYDAVLIPAEEYSKAKPLELHATIIEQFLTTLEHLRDENGLFASGYPIGSPKTYEKVRNFIKEQEKIWKENREKLLGSLIYIELEDNDKITSMGHHYYYRWRYANTIRTFRQSAGQYRVRAILAPVAGELSTDDQGKPGQLSASRLLFGYTSHREKDPLKQDGLANIGSGTYQRLAGRIHINNALEKEANGRNNKRFMDDGQALALQPLGQPKPSAVEHYLAQPRTTDKLKEHRKDGGQMLSYGDLTELPNNNQDTPALLAGRKFYLHQPSAVTDKSCYQSQNPEHIKTKQAMLARFVSRPDTQFRFSLRFKDLRPWELGALLLALAPANYWPSVLKILIALKPEHSDALEKIMAKISNYTSANPSANKPLFAHKLGHARPLGFGSVLLNCDQLKMLASDSNGMPTLGTTDLNPVSDNVTQWLQACAEKLAEHLTSVEHLENWCAVHQYAGRTRSAYPTALPPKPDPKKEPVATIFQHHSNARNAHIASRRLNLKKAKLSTAILNPLPFNPKP